MYLELECNEKTKFYSSPRLQMYFVKHTIHYQDLTVRNLQNSVIYIVHLQNNSFFVSNIYTEFKNHWASVTDLKKCIEKHILMFLCFERHFTNDNLTDLSSLTSAKFVYNFYLFY